MKEETIRVNVKDLPHSQSLGLLLLAASHADGNITTGVNSQTDKLEYFYAPKDVVAKIQPYVDSYRESLKIEYREF